MVYSCKSPKEEMIEQITNLENSDSAFSIIQINDLFTTYNSFVEKYPDDKRAPEFMFKAAQRSNILNKSIEGISLFKNLILNYPNSKFCEQALFSIAYSYENNLNDFVNAHKYYDRIAADQNTHYPDTE